MELRFSVKAKTILKTLTYTFGEKPTLNDKKIEAELT